MAAQTKRHGSPMLHTLMGVQVLGTGSYAPEHVVTNEDLARLGMDSEWIIQRTGIRERRHVPPHMATSDICAAAGAATLERAGVAPDEIDLIVLGTFTPDCPVASTAAMVQERLGLSCGAVEISSACSGFVYALVTAAQFIATGASKKALVIGGDCNSRVVDPIDPKIYPLFGDGAGAVVLGPGSPEQGLAAYTLGVDGSGAEMLYKVMGGSRVPPSHAGLDAGLNLLRMDGKGVFKWATRILCDTIADVLEHARLDLSDIDLFVLHQANLRIIEAAADYLKIDREKLVINIDRFGNTSGGSVPLALDEAMCADRIRRGDRILLSGYGAGLSWGTAIFSW
jgi:3-oxoacyl-[acyl-carrier-protein] synthase III